MTDTAIPIPDDAQARMDALARQVQGAAEQITRALGATTRDAEKGIQALGRILNRPEEQ